jgi:hypothetical protein
MIDRYTAGITGLLSVFIVALLGIHLLQNNSLAADQAGLEDIHMGSNEHYQAKLTTVPTTVQAEQSFQLTLDLLEADGETPVTEFDEVHTKLLHLILVSEDLTQFLHVHPDYQGDGKFVLEDASLPTGARYVAFADFTPTGEHQQVLWLNLATDGAQNASPVLVAGAGAQEVTVGPLKITLDLAHEPGAGVEQNLVFHVADAETGAPLDTLDEYLGAAGHLVIVDETAEIYLHTHPAGHDMENMDGMEMPMQYGPDLEFMTEFPNTGLYKMWLQVQYQGEIYTAPFIVNVSEVAQPPADATHEADHTHG